jgi:hypothetical protein
MLGSVEEAELEGIVTRSRSMKRCAGQRGRCREGKGRPLTGKTDIPPIER